MIVEALRHEALGLRRSPVRLAALAVFLIASALALLAGARFVGAWTTSLEDAQRLQSESIDQARGWLAAGVKGPEDRPWVDIAEPLWQDWYAGARIGRAPAPLAAIAIGSTDDSPRILRVNRMADPFLEEGATIENPELGRTEAVDLVFVLAVFAPLLIGVVGLGCGAYERETGLDRLIAVQRGRASAWYLARAAAITILCGGVVLAVVLAAVIGAGGVAAGGLGLIVVALLYVALWGGLFAATAGAARTRREAALAYGGVWVLLVVLVPTLMSERSLSAAAANAGLTVALDQRAAQYAGYDEDVGALTEALYAARPALRDLPGAALDDLPPEMTRHVYDWRRAQRLVAENEAKTAEERAAVRAAERTMAWSPTVVMILATERLAGRDLASAAAFRAAAVDAIAARTDWIVRQAWRNEALGLDAFNALTASAPKAVETPPGGVAPHLLALSVWTLIAWGIGAVRVRRQEVGAAG
ncbi:MAG: hypothetical protein AAGC56_01285 [Pseudomonadota bacterium]